MSELKMEMLHKRKKGVHLFRSKGWIVALGTALNKRFYISCTNPEIAWGDIVPQASSPLKSSSGRVV